MPVQHRVLVVDDELGMRETLEIILQNAGYDVSVAGTPEAACALLENEHFDAVLTDLYMGNDRQAGMKLLTYIQEHAPHTPAIMMTAYGSVDTAIEAMRRGAVDYIQKPFKSNDEIRIRVKQAIAQRILIRENEALRMEQARRGDLENMIGQSPAFRELIVLVRKVATLPSTVAIHGESGAGKELVARALHQISNRGDKPFVAINCGGIPENLLESELFGHEKGAFTGAHAQRIGRFELAGKGTIFLDEIAEMSPQLQAKLLRVTQDGCFQRVGSNADRVTQARLLAATNRDLEDEVRQGRFREDLFYRLSVVTLRLPALRERVEDIPELVRFFLRRYAQEFGGSAPSIEPEAIQWLQGQAWPGNVRELENVIRQAMLLARPLAITIEHVQQVLARDRRLPGAASQTLASYIAELLSRAQRGEVEGVYWRLIADMEPELFAQAIRLAQGNQAKAARWLGITRLKMHEKLVQFGLHPSRSDNSGAGKDSRSA